MPPPKIIDVCRSDLFTPQADLEERFDAKTVNALLRIRDEYQWQSSSREWHRWKANQMLLETYQQAKRRHDTKTMERAAASYAKYNRVDLEDEQTIPYEQIVVQPFTATSDPSVLGIKPIENLDEKVKELTEKYRRESMDIEDVEYEEADLEEDSLFGKNDNEADESNIL